nr:hypothetical protein [Tanacetum cinerariifolium]
DTIVSDFNMDENFGNDDNHRDNLDETLHDTKSNVDEKNVKKLQQLFDDAEKPLFEGCKKFTKLFLFDVTKNGPPVKMLWYLSIIPRLKKLYANPKDAKLLHWHAEERKTDGKIRHVADSPQWKNIDRDFKKFGSEIKNIRFGLCSDVINPFKSLSSRHSTWPVLLCIYNLPPWLCMKRKYIMMSLLIQGPKQSGKNIDVYLRPLIDDMIDLWETSVEIYDAYKKERLQLFAMIYCTINDFPAYGNLSGYGSKGEKACPVCENCSHSRWLANCRKTIYMGHRRALHRHHPYRKKENLFDGTSEDRSMPKLMDGYATLSQVADLNITFRKKVKAPPKHGVNARKDILAMGIRSELAPQETNGKKIYLPPACYTFSKAEKTSFCKCLHGIKVSSGYSANIKNLFSMKDLKLLGMKSHDCHVLLTQMIPIAIRGLMPPQVRQTITKLCLFFNMIHSKVLDHKKLEELQRDIILILCQLEMYFPPSFFDVKVHLVSHIVEEIKIAGPVFLRYMYPFKRYMGFLKRYVRNRYRPEGSIIQGYDAEEVVQFYTNYMDDVTDIGFPQPRHQGRLEGVGTIRLKDVTPNTEDLEQAHFTLLQNMTYSLRMEIAKDSYYGVIEEIWELDCTTVVIPILKCKWVDNTRSGVKVDNDGFTCVNLSTNGYLYDPFILTKQVNQVFYVEDPLDKRYYIVLQSKRSIVGVDDVVDEDEYNKFDELPPFSIGFQSDAVLFDTVYLRSDHQEGQED